MPFNKRTTKLRQERSENISGVLKNAGRIPYLKENNYCIKNADLDGDAPKSFIRAWFYSQNSSVRKNNPKTWDAYIAKSAEKWYPHESFIEYMINRIGIELLGAKMNEVKLVVANGQIRFLSKYFLNKGEVLIHGAEICGEYLNDLEMAKEIANDKGSARELFTFEFISEAIENVFPEVSKIVLNDLVRMMCFDALVGNNDRHFYNWGIINTPKKSKILPRFAPIYDSARGLFWNTAEQNIVKYLESHKSGLKKVTNYVNNASPRISLKDNHSVDHFGLITFVKESKKEYRKIIDSLSTTFQEKKVLEMLNKELFQFISEERKELIRLVIQSRFKKVRES